VTDEHINEAENQAEKTSVEEAPSKKSGWFKYILVGAAGVFLVVVVATLTLVLTGDSDSKQSSNNTHHETSRSGSVNEQFPDHKPDSLSGEELDPEVIDMITEQLAILDYEPDPDEIREARSGGSVEDSIQAVNWLEQEKEALSKREKDLRKREKELERLNQEVSEKLLQIQQEESSRTAELAKLYDGMDAGSVAKLMANLDDRTVVSILPRMKTKNASAVLQLMPPQRAASLSKQLITIAEN